MLYSEIIMKTPVLLLGAKIMRIAVNNTAAGSEERPKFVAEAKIVLRFGLHVR